MSQILQKALESKKLHTKSRHPNYAQAHGERHFKATLHGLSPKRQEILVDKMSLDEMHSHKGLQKFRRMSRYGQERFAKKDSEESRAAVMKNYKE